MATFLKSTQISMGTYSVFTGNFTLIEGHTERAYFPQSDNASELSPLLASDQKKRLEPHKRGCDTKLWTIPTGKLRQYIAYLLLLVQAAGYAAAGIVECQLLWLMASCCLILGAALLLYNIGKSIHAIHHNIKMLKQVGIDNYDQNLCRALKKALILNVIALLLALLAGGAVAAGVYWFPAAFANIGLDTLSTMGGKLLVGGVGGLAFGMGFAGAAYYTCQQHNLAEKLNKVVESSSIHDLSEGNPQAQATLFILTGNKKLLRHLKLSQRSSNYVL